MDQIECLDRLIESNKDGAGWFRIAADESYDSPELIGLFNALSEERVEYAKQCAEILRSLGRAPSPPLSRIVRRAWRDTRSLVSKEAKDLGTRIGSALSLDAATLKEYEAALAFSWPADVRAVLERHMREMRAADQRLKSFLPPSAHP